MSLDFSATDIPGHTRHELTWVVSGSVLVEAASVRWRLTTEQALWIPAGVGHRVAPQPGALVFPLWFAPEQFDALWAEPRVIQRTPLLQECAQVLLQPGLTTLEQREQAARAAHRLLPRLADACVQLPLPVDPRARAVADALLADPACQRTLEGWAQVVHTSSKTLQRSFHSDTQLSFPEWRAAARLTAALRLLEHGEQVSQVASAVGYASTSGFIAAFRKRYGHTPARHRMSGEVGGVASGVVTVSAAAAA